MLPVLFVLCIALDIFCSSVHVHGANWDRTEERKEISLVELPAAKMSLFLCKVHHNVG